MKTILQICLAITVLASACSESSNTPETEQRADIPVQDSDLNPEPKPKKDTLAPGQYVKISTEFGDMYITLFDATPQHKANFIKLVEEGFYDSTTFHRVIDGFMIQGGDPLSKDQDTTNDGMGGPGYTIPAEFVDTLKHIRGAVAAARDNNPEKRSSGSQFYIVENHDGAHFLDRNYTVFGQVIHGLDVPDKICLQETNSLDRPKKNIYMTAEIIGITAENE